METMKLPPMGNLLNARAGMGRAPDPRTAGMAPPGVPPPASSLSTSSASPASPYFSMPEYYANMPLDYDQRNTTTNYNSNVISQEQRDLFMAQPPRCSGVLSGLQRIQSSQQTQVLRLQQDVNRQRRQSLMDMQRNSALAASAAAVVAVPPVSPPYTQQQPPPPPPLPHTMYSMAMPHMQSQSPPRAPPAPAFAPAPPVSKMPRFVVDNQETIAAKCKHGFGRMPRVATVDLPMAPRSAAGHVIASALAPGPTTGKMHHRTAKRLAREEKERRERRDRRERERLTKEVAAAEVKAPQKEQLPPAPPLSPSRVAKRRAQRASSSSSGSSSSWSAGSAGSAGSSTSPRASSRTSTPASSSLDAITSYVAHMSEAKLMPVLPGRTARHVSFHVGADGTQGFTICGHGTEQSYEMGGDAVLFGGVGGGGGSGSGVVAGPHDEERRWQALVYGVGMSSSSSSSPPHSRARTLPSLAEVAQMQPPTRASLDLPPLLLGTMSWPTCSSPPLPTLQPAPTQPALCYSSGLSPKLTKMSKRAADDDDAVIEEHIRRLETVIRSGGATRRVVPSSGESGEDGQGKTVVRIPPETAAQVGALLGVILREQFCKRRGGVEGVPVPAVVPAVPVADVPAAGQEGAPAMPLPSISEVFGH